jgi:UDP:flavonoid glycosyltransferase YjiC (YdhE family)
MRGLLRTWTEPLARPLEDLRRTLGLGPSRGHPLLEGAISPAGSFALFDPVLLDEARALPPRLQVVGFAEESLDRALPSDLLAFLHRHPHPLVFSFGTAGGKNTGRLYELASEACQALRMPAVFLSGDYDFKRVLPVDQMALDWAAPRLLFPRAAAVIHRGSISTCFQAVRGAAPQLILPMGFDQPDNAQRLQRLGVALTLNPLFATKRRIRKLLRRLLVDKNFPAAALRVMVRMSTVDGAQRAADLMTQQPQEDAHSLPPEPELAVGHVDVVL